MPDSKKQKKTIDEVFDEFIDEQEDRLSPATFEKYATVLDLLESYVERYWPGHDGEQEAITKAGGTYCGTYGPEDIKGRSTRSTATSCCGRCCAAAGRRKPHRP